MLGTITVARRFCGPPNSANGGYIAGRLAAFVDGPAEVTLRRPPPLDVEMMVSAGKGGGVLLRDGDALVATARPGGVEIDAFPPTDVAAARAAMTRSFPRAAHPLPGCFVCGPERHDGLGLAAGPLDGDDVAWNGLLASAWTPAVDLAGADGEVGGEFIWAALDCPTSFPFFDTTGTLPVLLGRMTAALERPARVGEDYVIVTWGAAHDGRKLFAEAVLQDAAGDTVAAAKTTWILVDEAALTGG